MFLIASTGRCGTKALCEALDRHGDHIVAHEPEPRLLVEAHAKHGGLPWRTPDLDSRLAFFRTRKHSRYGEAFRAVTLLTDVRIVAPGARVLVIVRDPLEYVRSAHALAVLERGDEWDRTRLFPADALIDELPLAERLAWHWVEVNRRLLDFVDSVAGIGARVVLHGPLEERFAAWAAFLGVRIHDEAAVRRYLWTRPNASEEREPPDGWDPDRLRRIGDPVWERARRMAGEG